MTFNKCYFKIVQGKCQKRTNCDFYLTILLRLVTNSCCNIFFVPNAGRLFAALHINAVY